jgi:DMSO/TMAO reductase YedYZ molybdopterin-dependent catalytic subunit
MENESSFWKTHQELTRRYFLRIGAAGATIAAILKNAKAAEPTSDVLASAVGKLESFMTPPSKFRDVSRGKPLPHSLPDEKKKEVGLTRETWRLEVISDKENPASIRKPFTKENDTALTFDDLLKLGEKHAVRFAKVMTCLNIGCPLGMGIWEGVPLREVIWLTQPRENLRRVFYYGYHNDDEKQIFRSSLPVGRILEDPYDLPPVILCYKLNGEWLDSQRGGPVRMVVPEAYGFKSVKWLSHVVLTNLYHANDTYANGNNDVDSPLKTFAATLSFPANTKPDVPLPITGYAQVGISGLTTVQVWIHRNEDPLPENDPYFLQAPWVDAEILSPPKKWGGELTDDKVPAGTLGFDAEGQPKTWPMRLAKVHWAKLMPALKEGEYTLHCRTIDDKGIPQPLPRPFRKSGHSLIEKMRVVVKA